MYANTVRLSSWTSPRRDRREHDWCKQYDNFIPVIDTTLFSTVMDRGCYNTAINKISMYSDENFSFGGILNRGNSFALSEPKLAGWVR